MFSIDEIIQLLATGIPTSNSMKLTSHASEQTGAALPPSHSTESTLKRDDWMMLGDTSMSHSIPTHIRPTIPDGDISYLTEDYGDTPENKRVLGGGVDFFSSLGTEHKKKKPEMPDPEKVSSIVILS